ncbi:CoxG family protein [Acidovorax sp. FJL06]|uniref:CoxG family protein n=1 Tax=Acidovorax sp. FJL06 TaxID=2153365 RepID=UPI000F57E257|nr:carbon monoxide dehydrogenase subunit G [Acidovorax sp. FJL06]RQO80017.1 carbon monoxide dehydrogenase [Acidovorax sp. FJL06]
MEMQASRTLAVSQQQAWEALNDPEVLKLCIPGCDKVEATGDNQYAVAMALKIGPVSAKFAGKITLSDIVPPESYNIAFDGSGGVAGFGKGNAQVKLVPVPIDGAGQASCELHYTVHASVGGKIAQLGQRLVDGAAKTMAEDFFKRFDNEMQRCYPRPEVPQANAAAGASTGGAVVEEPGGGGASASGGGVPVWVWAASVVALMLVAWWFNRA